MVLERKRANCLVEAGLVKRRRLWRCLHQGDESARATATSLADLPQEMLVSVLARMPAHDAALARAVCKRFKMAGDAVLNAALMRLVHRAEAQLREAYTEDHLVNVSSYDGRRDWRSSVSWALSYVTQQSRLLRAVCVRYLNSRLQAGEWGNHHISFYGGLVLDEAEQVLSRTAQFRRGCHQTLELLHVGQLRNLVERWVNHFHSQVEPQLMSASAVGLSPHPGCKSIDLIECCARVERHLEVSWDDTGEWCSGRGRYVLQDTSLRVAGARCQLLSARGQRSLHACLSRLASGSAQYASSHSLSLQIDHAIDLIDPRSCMVKVFLRDRAGLMRIQQPSMNEEDVWYDEGEDDEEEERDTEEEGSAAEEQVEELEEQIQDDNEQQQELEEDVVIWDEGVPREIMYDLEDDTVAVEVRFTCRRNLAPLSITPPPQRPLKAMERGSSGLRQPDLQLRLVFHIPGHPEHGHCCCLIQQGGRLRPINTVGAFTTTVVNVWKTSGDAASSGMTSHLVHTKNSSVKHKSRMERKLNGRNRRVLNEVDTSDVQTTILKVTAELGWLIYLSTDN